MSIGMIIITIAVTLLTIRLSVSRTKKRRGVFNNLVDISCRHVAQALSFLPEQDNMETTTKIWTDKFFWGYIVGVIGTLDRQVSPPLSSAQKGQLLTSVIDAFQPAAASDIVKRITILVGENDAHLNLGVEVAWKEYGLRTGALKREALNDNDVKLALLEAQCAEYEPENYQLVADTFRTGTIKRHFSRYHFRGLA